MGDVPELVAGGLERGRCVGRAGPQEILLSTHGVDTRGFDRETSKLQL